DVLLGRQVDTRNTRHEAISKTGMHRAGPAVELSEKPEICVSRLAWTAAANRIGRHGECAHAPAMDPGCTG
ncbi:MAG TPA: hypothetical protein VFE72_03245, partial [Lysobacter sp.]|nr:hypothetical protein [Lysobacter sp.]